MNARVWNLKYGALEFAQIDIYNNRFYLLNADKDCVRLHPSDCKLILKSLLDISEGDDVDALSLCGWNARGMGKIIVCKMDSIKNIVFEFEYNI